MIINATKSLTAFYHGNVIKSRNQPKIYYSSSRWQILAKYGTAWEGHEFSRCEPAPFATAKLQIAGAHGIATTILIQVAYGINLPVV
jgi:hypothetical protein